jgi:hypothetical protein
VEKSRDIEATTTPAKRIAKPRSVQNAEQQRKELAKAYKAEEKVPLYLSPMYRPYFGNVMQVSINGISIYFKVDGTTQLVPQTFADEITSRRMRIDTMLTRRKKLADVSANYESSPGELRLF